VITRRGAQCGMEVFPHRFRHRFSHSSRDRGGPEGDLMELNGWSQITGQGPMRRTVMPSAPGPRRCPGRWPRRDCPQRRSGRGALTCLLTPGVASATVQQSPFLRRGRAGCSLPRHTQWPAGQHGHGPRRD
jgi:hypothetical protein